MGRNQKTITVVSSLAADNNGEVRLLSLEESLWQVQKSGPAVSSTKATSDAINLNIKKVKEGSSFVPLSW